MQLSVRHKLLRRDHGSLNILATVHIAPGNCCLLLKTYASLYEDYLERFERHSSALFGYDEAGVSSHIVSACNGPAMGLRHIAYDILERS